MSILNTRTQREYLYAPTITAKDALKYAQSYLSEEANIEVFHVYHPQIDPVYPYLGTPSKSFFEQKELLVKVKERH